jgi:hypothetical protein
MSLDVHKQEGVAMSEELTESRRPIAKLSMVANTAGLMLIALGIAVLATSVFMPHENAHPAATVRAAPSRPACSGMHMESALCTTVLFWGGGTLLLLLGHSRARVSRQPTHFKSVLALCLKLLGLLVFAPGAIIAGLSVVALWSSAFAGETRAKMMVLALGLLALVALGGAGHALWMAGDRAERNREQRQLLDEERCGPSEGTAGP